MESTIDDLKRKSEEILHSNESLKALIEGYNQEIIRLKKEIDARTQYDEKTIGNIGKLRDDLEGKTKIIKQILEEMKPLKQELEKKNEALEEMEQRLEETAKENMIIKTQMQQKEQTTDSYGAQAKQLQMEISQKEDMVMTLKRRLAEQTMATEMGAKEQVASRKVIKRFRLPIRSANSQINEKPTTIIVNIAFNWTALPEVISIIFMTAE
jgi:chromosome segregation ATPase